MTSELMPPFEGCHEHLSAKCKVQTTSLSERDCHSTESSIQRRIPYVKDILGFVNCHTLA